MSINTNSPSPEISSFTTPTEIKEIQTPTNDSCSLPNIVQTTTTQNFNVINNGTPNPPSLPNPKGKKFSIPTMGDCIPSTRKISVSTSVDNKNSTTTTVTTAAAASLDEKPALSNLIRQGISDIEKALEKLRKFKDEVRVQVEEAREEFRIKEGGGLDELRELNKRVTKLKIQISSKYKLHSEENDPHRNQQSDGSKRKRIIVDKLLDKMPQLYKDPIFENASAFQDFQALYDGLSIELQLCLLCFSVFPENAIIKKRHMVYWWIAERFVPPIKRTSEEIAGGKTAEDFANEFFHQLMEKGFIEPVYDKQSLMVGCCTMHPFIRSAVVMLAERAKFFDFDWKGNPVEDFTSSYRACLAGQGLVNIPNLEKLHMLFNVNENILEFKREWFLKMRNINVLCLGRWQTLAAHHIEVEDTDFLNGLESMNHLRLFSLQGVSRITELPKSVSQLTNLTILDLRACHNLEVIPDGIGLLKSLTHLDMSECYLIDHMPKGLALLSELQVLKGFVVGDLKGKHLCTLDDLVKLPKLRKFGIYTGAKDFPTDLQLKALNQFEKLRKLKVAWGRGSSHNRTEESAKHAKDAVKSTAPDTTYPDNRGQDNSAAEPAVLPSPRKPLVASVLKKALTFGQANAPVSIKPLLPLELQKLDLHCFPETFAPNWLKPINLKKLEKLYIRGGKLCDLGQFQEFEGKDTTAAQEKVRWQVKTLRLKYLTGVEMDWRELKDLFPDLIYLEKVKCPKLTLFPCDESGVWMMKIKTSKQLHELQEMAS